jgi:ElaB/YqjD/DUF883 family membrane-anchored ribosome-binding protein
MTHHHISKAALEDDIEATRSRIDGTIDAIERKLSPMQMASQLFNMTKAGGGDLASSLASSAKAHPLPMTLLSIGTGWLMLSERKQRSGTTTWTSRSDGAGAIDKARDVKRRAESKLHDAVDRTQGKAQEIKENMKQSAHDTMDRLREEGEGIRERAEHIRERASELRETASTTMEENIARLRDTATQLMDTNPLAAGALMVAVGALIGGALPATERERQLFGKTGEKAKGMAGRAAQRGAEMAEHVAHAALDETRHAVEDIASEVKERQPALH